MIDPSVARGYKFLHRRKCGASETPEQIRLVLMRVNHGGRTVREYFTECTK